MSKFLMFGMPLSQVIACATVNAARVFPSFDNRGTLNIGFGFLYYGLVRTLRPAHAVVIGSGFGFSVVCLALGLNDNGAGALSFVR